MTAPSFVQPPEDAADARARRDAPDVRRLVQALEDATARCAADPDGAALDERPVLKAVRLVCHYLTDEHGADPVRAAFRQTLRGLADLANTRVAFELADGATILWLDLYPPPDEADAARGHHVYLDTARASTKARTRWAAVVARPGKRTAAPAAVVEPLPRPARPSKRYDAGGEW